MPTPNVQLRTDAVSCLYTGAWPAPVACEQAPKRLRDVLIRGIRSELAISSGCAQQVRRRPSAWLGRGRCRGQSALHRRRPSSCRDGADCSGGPAQLWQPARASVAVVEGDPADLTLLVVDDACWTQVRVRAHAQKASHWTQ